MASQSNNSFNEIPGTSAQSSSAASSLRSSVNEHEDGISSESQMEVLEDISDDSVIVEVEENFEEYFTIKRKIAHRGEIWSLYEPKVNDDSLYSKILKVPSHAKHEASELLSQYISGSKEEVMRDLIIFCINLSGFQNFEVQKFGIQNYEKVTKNILLMLEEEVANEPVLDSGRCLLMETSSALLTHIKMGLYTFLQALVNVSHEMEVLYDDIFLESFVTFIKYMADSDLKCVRHTGVIIGLKVLRGIVLILGNFTNNENLPETEFTRRKNILQSLLFSLYIIVYQNCRLPDKHLCLMKLECMQECKIWLKYFPTLFGIQYQLFDLLTSMVSDESEDVRFTALDICQRFLLAPNIVQLINYHAKKIITVIMQRFDDLGEKVQVKAFRVFKCVIQSFLDHVTLEIIQKIKDMVFHKSAIVGRVASACLLLYFRQQNHGPLDVLIDIVKIIMYKKNKYCKEFLVESFLHSSSEIKDWELFCKCFLNEKMDGSLLSIVAEVFAESVKQLLSGKSSTSRLMSSKKTRKADPKEHQKVADIMGQLNNIVIKHCINPRIISNIVKIVNQVDFKKVQPNFDEELSRMAALIAKVFELNSNKHLLIQASHFFFTTSEIPRFKENGKTATEVCSKYGKLLFDLLLSPGADDNDVILKVSFLYKYFNIYYDNLLTFNHLLKSLGEHNVHSVSRLMVVIKWNLIWSLKALPNLTPLSQQRRIHLLSTNCAEFLSSCIQYIIRSQNKKLTIEMFQTLCDFVTHFTKKLNEVLRISQNAIVLKLKFRDEYLQEKLDTKIRTTMLDTSIPLPKRRKIVNGYIEIVNCELIVPKALSNIYKYFHSHSSEFGEILENSLNLLKKNHGQTTISTVILNTLVSVYEELLQVNGDMELTSKHGMEFNLLAEKFSTIKLLQEPFNALQLVLLLMQAALRDESKLNLLFFIKCFVQLLHTKEDKQYILDEFNHGLKEELRSSRAVRYFKMILC